MGRPSLLSFQQRDILDGKSSKLLAAPCRIDTKPKEETQAMHPDSSENPEGHLWEESEVNMELHRGLSLPSSESDVP